MKVNGINVSELGDKEYISKIIGKYQKDFSQIKDIKLEEQLGGPLDFSLLRKVSIFDYEDKLISELFAKIYNPKKPVINFSMHNVEDNKRFWYAAMQQRFWNYIKIPSPPIHDFIDKEEYKVLLMGFWSGPSHALDISVIKDAIEKRDRDIEKGTILDNRILDRIKEEK